VAAIAGELNDLHGKTIKPQFDDEHLDDALRKVTRLRHLINEMQGHGLHTGAGSSGLNRRGRAIPLEAGFQRVRPGRSRARRRPEQACRSRRDKQARHHTRGRNRFPPAGQKLRRDDATRTTPGRFAGISRHDEGSGAPPRPVKLTVVRWPPARGRPPRLERHSSARARSCSSCRRRRLCDVHAAALQVSSAVLWLPTAGEAARLLSGDAPQGGVARFPWRRRLFPLSESAVEIEVRYEKHFVERLAVGTLWTCRAFNCTGGGGGERQNVQAEPI